MLILLGTMPIENTSGRKEGANMLGRTGQRMTEGVHLLSAVGACYVSHVRERAGNHRVLEAPE
jgi:hypothetical protein